MRAPGHGFGLFGLFNFGLIIGETFVEFGVFWVLLDRADGAFSLAKILKMMVLMAVLLDPIWFLNFQNIFETNGKEVSLLSIKNPQSPWANRPNFLSNPNPPQ